MKTVAVVSGKGGTGKSFVTCNIGAILAGAKFKTLIIDADVDMASIELLYGISAKKTLQDFVNGEATVDEVVHEGSSGAYVVPAGIQLKRRIRPSEFDHAVGVIAGEYDVDVILFDAPAGVGPFVQTCIKLSDEYLLVANPEVTSIVDAYKLKKLADQNGKHLGTVLNKANNAVLSIKKVEDNIGPIIAAIPYDNKVPATINDGIPYVVRYPRSLVTKQIAKAASAIANVEIEVAAPKKFEFKLPFRNR